MKKTIALSVLLVFTAIAEAHQIRFVVTVPANTTPDKHVYIVGDHPNLGGWRPDMIFMTRRDDGRYEVTIDLPTGTYEHKFTRGSWSTVEKSETGMDIGNRLLHVDGDETIEMTVANWGRVDATRKSTISGTVRRHEQVASKQLGNSRTVVVYLPPNYDEQTDRRYPVFYMHDGQNLFDVQTSAFGVEWEADETAERLIREGTIEPIIIVGIYNTPARMDEYTPDRSDNRNGGGRGDLYAKFLIEELKPTIDKTYRTKPDRANTAVGGSSLGGLISLHIAMTHPEVFGKCAAVSPSLMWNHQSILKRIHDDSRPLKRVRLWFDMGTAEGVQIATFQNATRHTRRLERTLKAAGFEPDRDFKYLEVGNGEHNEASWARRFNQILIFLFPAKEVDASRNGNQD